MRKNIERAEDKADLLSAFRTMYYIAVSFVFRQDLIDFKSFLHENGGDDIAIIAKIEKRQGSTISMKSAKSAKGL